MKYFRFKKEFAKYGKLRTKDENFDPNSIMLFADEAFPMRGPRYSRNIPKLWVYPEEIEEVTDEKAIEVLKKEYSKGVEILLKNTKPKEGLGAFAFKTKEGNFLPQHAIACHFAFNGSSMEDACTWNLFLLNKETKRSIRELIEWLINDSPWIHCISPRWGTLSRRVRTTRALNGPVPVNMDAPANEVVGFAIAMRTITEFEWTIPTYLSLRKMGASQAVAFMLTGYIQYTESGFVPYPNSNWHHYLDDRMSVKDVCKFFKEGYFLENRSISPFNKVRYTFIAEQVARLRNSEYSFESLKHRHQKKVGEGFNACVEIDAQAIINEVNQIWGEA